MCCRPTRRCSRASSVLAAATPISCCGIATVVRGGWTRSMNGMSLWPVTETSSGHAQAGRRQRGVAAERDHVVAGDDRGDLRVLAQQLRAACLAGFDRERLAVHDRALAERGEAPDRGREGERARHVRDPLVAELAQVGDDRSHAGRVVGGHQRQRAGLAGHEHGGEVRDLGGADRRGDDQPLAAPLPAAPRSAPPRARGRCRCRRAGTRCRRSTASPRSRARSAGGPGS